jgi:hypothetical protein
MLNYSEFTGSFSGRVKINTGFNWPLYKPFKVMRDRSYQNTGSGFCTINGQAIESGKTEHEGVYETLQSC